MEVGGLWGDNRPNPHKDSHEAIVWAQLEPYSEYEASQSHEIS